jgi:hypothetical protein
MIERVSRVKRENEVAYDESRHGLRDTTGLSEGSKAKRDMYRRRRKTHWQVRWRSMVI